MYQIQIDNFDLTQIAKSGQCFRWHNTEPDTYEIIAFDKLVEIRQNGNYFTFSCDKDEFETIWAPYIDISTDYKAIGKLILESDDAYLKAAYNNGIGVRILKQDLWETIVTFMISQNNNISRITKSVDAICRLGARTVPGYSDKYCFPKPEDINGSSFYDRALGLGYRSKYLDLIYTHVKNNPSWLTSVSEMNYDDAMKALLEIKGIGKKVANCICLFGLHHVDAFPIDTHVKQILAKHYPNGFNFERYKGIAGIVQQYMFYNELLLK